MQSHGQLAGPRDVASSLLSTVAAAAVCVLSFLEHGRNVAPSTLLTTYLGLVVLSDAVRAGLLYAVCGLGQQSWGRSLALLAAELIVFTLESQTKEGLLREPYDTLSPEEKAGFWGRAFFWWTNSLLRTGYAKRLSFDDLPPFDASADALKAREVMQREWDKRSTSLYMVLFLVSSSFCPFSLPPFLFDLTLHLTDQQKTQPAATPCCWPSAAVSGGPAARLRRRGSF